MNIKIRKLELTNFKCFRHKEISFDQDVTTIRGRNGVGKTTIADAILWTLFGKNSQGQAKFDLKTHDSDGKVIPNLDHSVQMELMITDGTSFEGPGSANLKIVYVTIKRTLKENWIKKRGATEQVFKDHSTEFIVNGQEYQPKDYEKYISSLISEDVFKAITSPTYFPSLKWQQQREFLTAMVGSIEPEYIAGSDDDLVALVHLLDNSNDDIISHRQHLSYQIKEIKKKLDKIPVRLEEQHKALPEKLDWESLNVQSVDVSQQLEEVRQKITSINSGNGGDVLREQIRTELKDLQNSIEKIEDTERKAYNLRRQDHDNNIAEAQRKFNSLITTQKDLELQMQSFDNLKKRIQETLDQCENDAQAIRDEWAHNLSRTFHFHEADGVCPTCGQYLPESQIAEKRQKAEENLNADKARIKQELTEKANKVKATRAEAEKELQGFDDTKAQAEKNLADIKEQINQVFSDKMKLEKEQVLSAEQELANHKQYQELLQTRDELRKKLDSVGINEDSEKQLAELEAKRVEYVDVLQQLNTQLATKSQYDKIQSLITGIEQEQKDLVTQLSELERKEDIARRYQDRQNAILESRVNEHFSLVKWRMFRTVNNGGDPFDEPFCECYVDGVAYHDGLNQAARLNAGLDIIACLCKHYNVSAPIVVDNSESNLNILPTTSQQIRLEVFDSDLQIV